MHGLNKDSAQGVCTVMAQASLRHRGSLHG